MPLLKHDIKQKAKSLGFADIGIAKVRSLDKERKRFKDRLKNYGFGEMTYLNRNIEMRFNPALLLENAKSVVVCLYNYYPEKQQRTDTYKISKYAYGKDYHYVVKSKLYELLNFIKNKNKESNGRVFVDSAPLHENTWAVEAGLGWTGKNSLLITKKGSYFFIGEIVLDIEIEPDTPIKSYCGNCTRCIDACPTNAIFEPYKVDANRCISYLTIENKNEIPSIFKGKFDDWIFGCDICQDVCPYNRKPIPTTEPEFIPKDELLSFSKSDWENLSKEDFNYIFRKSAVKRAKYEGFMRNIVFVSNNKND